MGTSARLQAGEAAHAFGWCASGGATMMRLQPRDLGDTSARDGVGQAASSPWWRSQARRWRTVGGKVGGGGAMVVTRHPRFGRRWVRRFRREP